MTRPVNADAARTRAAIFAAALDSFGRIGRDGTTVRDVARAAGVTLATVHHYFGTKDALYAACLDEAFDHQLACGAEVLAAALEAPRKQAVAAGVRVAFRAVRKSPERFRFLMRAFLFEQGPELHARLREGQRNLFERSAELILPKTKSGIRIPLVALGVLIARFALAEPDELGLFGEEVGDAGHALEEYLVHLAGQSLALGSMT